MHHLRLQAHHHPLLQERLLLLQTEARRLQLPTVISTQQLVLRLLLM
jgi:hypothetical protein